MKEGNLISQQGVVMINGKLYEGFCIEVAEKIKERYERLEGKGPGSFNYKFKLVDDNNFGSPNKTVGTWNGMIGELLEQVMGYNVRKYLLMEIKACN